MKIQTSIRVENSFYQEAKDVCSKFGLSFGLLTRIQHSAIFFANYLLLL